MFIAEFEHVVFYVKAVGHENVIESCASECVCMVEIFGLVCKYDLLVHIKLEGIFM